MRYLQKSNFLFLLCCTLLFNTIFSAASPQCSVFQEGSERCAAFAQVCEYISNELQADGPSCFISYAWHQEGSPLNEWSTKFNEFLSRAGIATTYDTSTDRGLQGNVNAFISEIAKKQTTIVLLTPQYKKNVELGRFVKEEVIRILEHKPLTRFVLLAGSRSTSVPEEFRSLKDQLYYPMTTADVYDLEEYPGHTESLFYSVLCDLLDPNRHNLLRLLSGEKKEKITSVIKGFQNRHLVELKQYRADDANYQTVTPNTDTINREKRNIIHPQNNYLRPVYLNIANMNINAQYLAILLMAFYVAYTFEPLNHFTPFLVVFPFLGYAAQYLRPLRISQVMPLMNEKTSLKRVKSVQEIADVLSKYNKSVIFGVGGSGKTVLARMVAAQTKSNYVFEINAKSHETFISSVRTILLGMQNAAPFQE